MKCPHGMFGLAGVMCEACPEGTTKLQSGALSGERCEKGKQWNVSSFVCVFVISIKN